MEHVVKQNQNSGVRITDPFDKTLDVILMGYYGSKDRRCAHFKTVGYAKQEFRIIHSDGPQEIVPEVTMEILDGSDDYRDTVWVKYVYESGMYTLDEHRYNQQGRVKN